MRAKTLLIVAGLLALTGITAYLARSAWVTRHDPSLQTLRSLARECEAVIKQIEGYSQLNGSLPKSLEDLGLTDSAWRYDLNETASDFELYRTHSHWVSSFNAFLYASDGTPRSRWDGLRTIEHGPYRYFIGAQHAEVDW